MHTVVIIALLTYLFFSFAVVFIFSNAVTAYTKGRVVLKHESSSIWLNSYEYSLEIIEDHTGIVRIIGVTKQIFSKYNIGDTITMNIYTSKIFNKELWSNIKE